MKQGIWKKYEKKQESSSDELYKDLKNSGKNWPIVNDYGECVEELFGEFLPCEGRSAGDIYVYYTNNNGNLVPEFYMKIEEYKDSETKEKKNYIEFSFINLEIKEKISNDYLPVIIDKLREIDETKNKYYIETFEKKYENYQMLLSLKQKDTFNEDELLFLYDMAYRIREGYLSTNVPEISIPIVQNRDIQQDFESLSIENKSKLFLSIKGSEICDKLKISDKNVLMLLAKTGCISQLRNVTEDIINDKSYILKLLSTFFKRIKATYSDEDSFVYLSTSMPLKYQSDIDVLKVMIYEYGLLSSMAVNDWTITNPTLREKMTIPSFAYDLIDSHARSLIQIDRYIQEYPMNLLWRIPDEILNDIEDHILIGPESTKEKEERKKRIIKQITSERSEIYSYRHKSN